MVEINFAIDLGRRIREARERQDMTQATLGAPFEITPQAVSQWEKGDTIPGVEKLPIIARMLNVSIEWLLTGQERPEDWPRSLWHQLKPSQQKLALVVLKGIAGDSTEAP